MKVRVNLNRIPDSYKILDDFEKARQYHLKHGVSWEFEFVNTDVRGYTSTFSGTRWLIQGSWNLVQLEDCLNMFVFDEAEWASPTGSPFPLRPDTPTGNCFMIGKNPFINIPAYLADHTSGAQWIVIAHELVHALAYLSNQAGYPLHDVLDSYFMNSDPDYPTGNFAQMWTLLAPFIKTLDNTNMWPYKHFGKNESTGGGHTCSELKPELLAMLDKARDIASIPFVITSGFRTPAENTSVGGVNESAHETGLAVDLKISDGISGEKINSALHQTGFKRFGYYSDGHLHVDIDYTKPYPCYWVK